MAITAKWSDFSNLDSDHLIAVLNKRLPRWVMLMLVVVIAWQMARIVWMIMPGPTSSGPIAVPAGMTVSGSTNAAQTDVSIIANAHLFGVAAPEDAVPEAALPATSDLDSLPDARVAFSVKGIVAAADPEFSVAILADQSKEENVYGIGDIIQTGTTLHEVHDRLIVIRQNGALYKMELPNDFPQGTPSTRRSSPQTQRAASTNTQSIQNVVSQNVSKLADVIRPTPYFVGGQQQGYRVYPGRDRKQFAKLGLRPGDLIKDIDGASLTDPQQALQIFENLGSAEEVSVTVERNGQPQTLVLKTSQLELNKDK